MNAVVELKQSLAAMAAAATGMPCSYADPGAMARDETIHISSRASMSSETSSISSGYRRRQLDVTLGIVVWTTAPNAEKAETRACDLAELIGEALAADRDLSPYSPPAGLLWAMESDRELETGELDAGRVAAQTTITVQCALRRVPT